MVRTDSCPATWPLPPLFPNPVVLQSPSLLSAPQQRARSPPTAVVHPRAAPGQQPSSLPGGQILSCCLAQPHRGLPPGQCLSSPSQTPNRQQHLHVYPITEQPAEQAKHILTLLRETETSTSTWGGGGLQTSLGCFVLIPVSHYLQERGQICNAEERELVEAEMRLQMVHSNARAPLPLLPKQYNGKTSQDPAPLTHF